MGNAFIKESTLTAIANAIRAKTGGTATMLPSEMAGEITNMKVGGGSGSYVWTKQGMADTATEDTTGGTYTLTTPNTTRPSTEIEYSTTAPTYDSSKRQWIFANSTKVTLVNSDATLPSISGNVYVRVTSEPNIWYLVSAFDKGSSSPYLKNMTYSKKYTAAVDWVKKYLTDIDGGKYPTDGWLDGYYYKRTVADPNVKGGGQVWIKQNGNAFNVIHANNNITVLGGQLTGLWYIENGVITQSNVTSSTFNAIYYANGLWVAGGYDNGLYYSTDGKNWTQSNVTSDSFYAIYYANGLWVAGCNNGLYYSTNCKTWTRSNITSVSINLVYYANGLWVTGSNSGLYYSTDGKNWILGLSRDASGWIFSVYYGDGLWVAGCNNGLYYSTNCKTWTRSNITSVSINLVYYANGLWVTGSNNNGLYYSTDGKTWTQSNQTSSSYDNSANKNIYFYNGTWVAGSETTAYYSTDGKNWTRSNLSDWVNMVLFIDNKWIIVGNAGLYYSDAMEVEVDF